MTIAIVATVALTVGAVVGYALGWWLARSTKPAPSPWADYWKAGKVGDLFGFPVIEDADCPKDTMYFLDLSKFVMEPSTVRRVAKFTDITES
jgi:hypothetical protein